MASIDRHRAALRELEERKANPFVVSREKDDEGNLTVALYDPLDADPVRTATAVAWAPQPGSQFRFLACPYDEVLLAGNRGGGKTDALLMDFAQGVGQGYGEEWVGLLFRQTYKQLTDVINKSIKWFSKIFPEASYNKTEHTWTWPTGERLMLRYMDDPADYWNYHGWNVTWLGWEELTNWAEPTCYLRMFSVLRSTKKNIPLKVRATANPGGPGNTWVKHRFRIAGIPATPTGPLIKSQIKNTNRVRTRIAIFSDMQENKMLLDADPDYQARIREAAKNLGPAYEEAWIKNNWDIVAGSRFSDWWREGIHVIPNIDWRAVPRGWLLNRSYDHGQSKPFSVGWWAESNGEPIQLGDGRIIGEVPGDLIRMYEWYGCSGEPNVGLRMASGDIAQGIRDREEEWELVDAGRRIYPGPADNAIFDEFEPNTSVAGKMIEKGIYWERSDKRPGSRVAGWQRIEDRLKGAMPDAEGFREQPGLWVTRRCVDFRRTIPVLPRDENNPDDVNTKAEDHIADEVRYRVGMRDRRVSQGTWK